MTQVPVALKADTDALTAALAALTGNVFVKRATRAFNNAEIKALPTHCLQIVAAPAAGKMILPIVVAGSCDVTAGVYTNVDTTADHGFVVGAAPEGSNGVVQISKPFGAGMLTDNSGVNALASIALGISDGTNTMQALASNHDGVALSVAIDNGVLGNLTGGNAANALTITVWYVVVDL